MYRGRRRGHLMKSKLPITGTCHYCGKPTEFRFCAGTSCQRLYWYRRERPVVKRVLNVQKPAKTEAPKDTCKHGKRPGELCTPCRNERRRTEHQKNPNKSTYLRIGRIVS